MSEAQRNAMLFVDQENLKVGAKEYGKHYKYDFEKLRNVLLDGFQCVGSHWFASWNPEETKPMSYYLALKNNGYTVHTSERVSRDFYCSICNRTQEKYIEKGVDVHLATVLVSHAYEHTYDVAILLTGDSDFKPAVTSVQQTGKKVIIAGWAKNTSMDLRKEADEFIPLETIADEIAKTT